MKPGAPFDAGYPDYFLARIAEDGLFDNLGDQIGRQARRPVPHRRRHPPIPLEGVGARRRRGGFQPAAGLRPGEALDQQTVHGAAVLPIQEQGRVRKEAAGKDLIRAIFGKDAIAGDTLL